MQNIIRYLETRGALDNASAQDLEKYLAQPKSFYLGFDPTAPSLHLGSLVGIVILKAFQNLGHKPYVLIGGATARIGDPSGKSAERPLLTTEAIEANVASLTTFFQSLLTNNGSANQPIIVNNNTWFSDWTFIDFLRDIGKYFRMGPMFSKESVKLRIASEEGMSFTEFSYQALQGYDFLHLFKSYGVTLQLGGSDQWGNITAGIELVRKKMGAKVYGLTFPLLTSADGKKMGKTASGAIWLSADKLSPFKFYQYLIQTKDADVVLLLKMLTLLEIEEIEALAASMKRANYVPNTLQKRLAQEVTRFIHGEKGLQTALKATEATKPGAATILNKEALEAVAKDIPSYNLDNIAAQTFVEVALKAGLVCSKSEAVRLVNNRGAYINNERVEDPYYVFSKKDLIENTFILLAAGKKRKVLIRVAMH